MRGTYITSIYIIASLVSQDRVLYTTHISFLLKKKAGPTTLRVSVYIIIIVDALEIVKKRKK